MHRPASGVRVHTPTRAPGAAEVPERIPFRNFRRARPSARRAPPCRPTPGQRPHDPGIVQVDDAPPASTRSPPGLTSTVQNAAPTSTVRVPDASTIPSSPSSLLAKSRRAPTAVRYDGVAAGAVAARVVPPVSRSRVRSSSSRHDPAGASARGSRRGSSRRCPRGRRAARPRRQERPREPHRRTRPVPGSRGPSPRPRGRGSLGRREPRRQTGLVGQGDRRHHR